MKKIVTILLQYSKFEIGFECLRIYLGSALFIKGIHFIVVPQDLAFFLSQSQLNVFETFTVHYVITAHLIGGLLLAIGLLTKFSALIQVPILIGALTLVHSNETLFSVSQNIELTGLVLFLLLIFCFIGSGRLSTDYYLFGDKKLKEKTMIRQFIEKIILNTN